MKSRALKWNKLLEKVSEMRYNPVYSFEVWLNGELQGYGEQKELGPEDTRVKFIIDD